MKSDRKRCLARTMALALAAWVGTGLQGVAGDELDALLGEQGLAEGNPAPSSGNLPEPDAPAPSEDRNASDEPGTTAAPEESEKVAATVTPAARLRPIEEIVVTAQRREESLDDVPISISVIDDELIAREGLTDLTDVSRYVPNAKLNTDGASGQQVNIRGFDKQSGNAAFEQAVALVVDGVTYNENDFFMMGLVDLERIEVLRGPQGTLFGKNSTAGLINITTKEASEEIGGYMDLQGGESGRRRAEGAIGGPVLPGLLNVRIAALSDERDGVFENTTSAVVPGIPDSQLARERRAVRAKIELPSILGSRLRLQYERAEISALGIGVEMLLIDEGSADVLRDFDPNVDLEPNNFITSDDEPGKTDRTVQSLVARWDYDLRGWGLQAIAGWANVSSTISGGDTTPAPLTHFFFDIGKPQYSAELITTSPVYFAGALDFTSGIFYQRRQLDPLILVVSINDAVFSRWLAADDAGNAGAPGLANTNPLEPLPTPVRPGAFLPLPGEEEQSTITFNQSAESLAGYGQFQWRFAEQWSLTAGGRVTHEEKQADWQRVFDTANTVVVESILGWQEFTAADSRSELLAQPKIALNYQPFDGVSLFAHFAQGFRSGGFNSTAGRPEGLTFEREVVTEWALNAKTSLLGGALRFNAGLFHMNLEDFQLLTTGPNDISAVTTNAGSARARGVELDALWLPVGWLTLMGTLGLNDAEFTEFPFGPCPPDRPNFDGDEDERCDLTGAELPFAPKWTGTFSVTSTLPLAGLPGFAAIAGAVPDLHLQPGLSLLAESRHSTGLPADRRYTQDAYVKLKAQVALGSPAQGWSLRVVGENLTNTAVNRGIGTLSGSNNFVQALEPPRLVFAQLRWEF